MIKFGNGRDVVGPLSLPRLDFIRIHNRELVRQLSRRMVYSFWSGKASSDFRRNWSGALESDLGQLGWLKSNPKDAAQSIISLTPLFRVQEQSDLLIMRLPSTAENGMMRRDRGLDRVGMRPRFARSLARCICTSLFSSPQELRHYGHHGVPLTVQWSLGQWLLAWLYVNCRLASIYNQAYSTSSPCILTTW